MAKDYYAILGVSRDASAEDIKKAYRRLSKELHPDKHKGKKDAETKFKEINQAYETLSHAEKKKMYDRFGEAGNGAGPGGGEGGFDFSGFQGFQSAEFSDLGDMFQSFFGRGAGAEPDQNAGRSYETEVELTLADVLRGRTMPITLSRQVACHTCAGSGAASGTSTKKCEECDGTGTIIANVRSLFGNVQQRMRCNTCRGAGKIPKELCVTCRGEGRVQERSTITVNIPAGINAGQSLLVRGQGDAGRRGAKAGDVRVKIHIRQDPRFERHKEDIHSSIAISALDAILGAEVPVETLHGTSTLKVDAGLQPGQILRIKGKGLPELGSSRHGDHYVTVNVEIPKKLSREERRIVEEWRKIRE